MFILDLIRDYNKFVQETMVTWLLCHNKTEETLEQLRVIIEKYKKNTLYTIFTEAEEERYKEDLGKTDDEIMSMVANF